MQKVRPCPDRQLLCFSEVTDNAGKSWGNTGRQGRDDSSMYVTGARTQNLTARVLHCWVHCKFYFSQRNPRQLAVRNCCLATHLLVLSKESQECYKVTGGGVTRCFTREDERS